jgi:3-hydroxyisobutyrate dehydrogenase
MGGSLARHLLPDHELMVYDLNPAAVDAFGRDGAHAATPREIARASDVIVLCLPRSSDVETLLFGVDGIASDLRPGQLVIDQTSGIPAMTIHFARELEKRGVLFMDAPVSGGIPAAQNRTVTVIASGPDAAWERGEAILRGISSKVLRCGARVGDGQALKLITNGIGACYRLTTLELAALWRGFGLPLAELVSALNESPGANFTSRNMLVGLLENRSTTNFAMALMVKDLNGDLDLGKQAGQAMPLTQTARGLMQGAIGLFGKDSRLDDVIPLTEKLSAVRLAQNAQHSEAKAAPLPPEVPAAELLTILTRAAVACNIVSVLEGVKLGLKLGLKIDGMAGVIDAGSAWCRIAGPLLASLGGGTLDPAAYRDEQKALESAADLAAAAGLPFIMPGVALAHWRDGLA